MCTGHPWGPFLVVGNTSLGTQLPSPAWSHCPCPGAFSLGLGPQPCPAPDLHGVLPPFPACPESVPLAECPRRVQGVGADIS